MKRILLGALVGTIIFFIFQSIMWMGDLHGPIMKYSDKQDSVLNSVSENFTEEGLYMIPSVNPDTPYKADAEEKLWNERIGKPWAMIFYHKSYEGMSSWNIIIGILYSFFACFIAAVVMYYGSFEKIEIRFLISMAFAIFTLLQGTLDDMNWWSFPWEFIRAEVIDLTIGWGLTSLWLAWFVKKT